MVVVLPPPPRTSPDPILVTLPRATLVRRIYNPDYPGFRFYGPLGQRFDHQDPRYPPVSGSRGIYYAAPSLACCVAEVFADRGFVQIGNEWLAETHIGRDLQLLDLRKNGAQRAGTVHALSGIRERALTQEWSRYFYEYPELYGLLDGLLYPSAHNGADAWAFYERARDAFEHAAAVSFRPLRAPRVRQRVQRAAMQLRLPFLPPH